MNKKYLVPIVLIGATGIVGASILGASQVNAQTPLSGLATALAQKFNLNTNDVQSFLESYRQSHLQDALKARLDKMVTNGKITTSQESAIITEIDALRQKYFANIANMSDTDKKTAFQNAKVEFNNWANQNNIKLNLPIGPWGTRFGHFIK